MLEIVLKGIGIFLVFYFIWLITGGVERGEERERLGTNTLFIGVEGTALDNNSQSTEKRFPQN